MIEAFIFLLYLEVSPNKSTETSSFSGRFLIELSTTSRFAKRADLAVVNKSKRKRKWTQDSVSNPQGQRVLLYVDNYA